MITHTKKATATKARLSAKQRNAIITEKLKGSGTKALSDRYGVSEQTIRNITRDHTLARTQAKSETAMVAARVPVADIRAFEVAISSLGVDQKSTALRAFVRHPGGFLTVDAELAESVIAMRRELSMIGSNVNQIARRLNDPRLQPKDRKLSKRDAEVLHELRAAVTSAREHLAVLWGKKARARDAAFKALIEGADG
jgi:hypothetical protein